MDFLFSANFCLNHYLILPFVVCILGLATLRSKIAVIPQDPILFTGTIASNLDPFNEHSKEEMYRVLQKVGLYSTTSWNDMSSTTDGGGNSILLSRTTSSSSTRQSSAIQSLDDAVSEGGINFSVGQRQLLVIARALLCRASIIIMDEATASVDAETDAAIQKVMHTEFCNSTCLIIAHRLNSIMNSDLILVMDDGRAAEFDTPQALLQKPGGMFRNLVRANERAHQEH